MLIADELFRAKEKMANHIQRERVFELFQSKIKPTTKILLIEAPAGYGKSTAVADYVATLLRVVTWYPLELLENKSTLFFIWNLVRAIKQAGLPTKLVQQTELSLENLHQNWEQIKEPTQVLESITIRFFSELGRLQANLIIVIEDYHFATTLENDALLEKILKISQHLPQSFLLVVTSRHKIVLPIRARLEGQGMAETITEEEMTFTLEESQQLAAKMQLDLTPDMVELVFKQIGGWPILHHFLYRNLLQKTGEDVYKTIHSLSEVSSQYLAAELLAEESPIIQDFLCRTAVLQHLEPSICDTLLGSKNSQQLLEQLKGSVFLSQIGESFVHSHDIVRKFLWQTLHTRYTTEAIQQLHYRLGQYLENKSDWDLAIHHYLQGEWYEEITNLVERLGPSLIANIEFFRLEGWLKLIPPDRLNQDPILLTYWGAVLGNNNDPTADHYLLRALDLFQKQNDLVHIAWVKGHLSWVYSGAKVQEGLRLIKEALAVTDLPARLRAWLLSYFAMVMQRIDRFEEAISVGEKASSLFQQLGTVEDKIVLTRHLRYLSGFYASSGQVRNAVQIAQNAYQLAKVLHLSEWALGWICHRLANNYLWQGRFSEVFIYLDEAESLLGKYRDLGSKNILLNYLLGMRACAYREMYEYDKAFFYYRYESHDSEAIQLGIKVVQKGYEQEVLDLALQERDKSQNNTTTLGVAKFQTLLGIAYLCVKKHKEALTEFQESTRVFEDCNGRFYASTNQVYLAKIYFDLGNAKQGEVYLQTAFSHLAREGCYGLDVWHPWLVADVCAKAIELDIEVDYAERLALKRFRPEHMAPFWPLANHPNEAIRTRVARILHGVGDSVRVQTQEILKTCPTESTQKHLVIWLNEGWLTHLGLIRLRNVLTWRQLEIFLCWIHPSNQGSIEGIAEKIIGKTRKNIKVDTVNTNLKEIRQRLVEIDDETFNLELPLRKGFFLRVYHWAVKEGIVNGDVDPSW